MRCDEVLWYADVYAPVINTLFACVFIDSFEVSYSKEILYSKLVTLM